MPIVVTCTSCRMKLDAPDETIGKKVRCPNCQTVMDVKQEVLIDEIESVGTPDPFATIPTPSGAEIAAKVKLKVKLPLPGAISAAGMIWIGVGSLGLVACSYGIIRWIQFNQRPRHPQRPIPDEVSREAFIMGCSSIIGFVFAASFAYIGYKTVQARTKDPLAYGIWSLLFAVLQILMGGNSLAAGLGGGGGDDSTIAVIVGAVALFLGSLLLLAGVFAITGRSAFQEWRQEMAVAKHELKKRRRE